MKNICLLLIILISFKSNAQIIPDFAIPDTVCVNEPINIVNNTTGATTYKWNFCKASINPILKEQANLGNPQNYLDYPNDVCFVIDNSNYYIFIPNQGTSSIIKINFGNSPKNNPISVTDLGTFGGILGNLVDGMQIIKENGNWYAILTNANNSSNYSIVRLNFGNSINNIPTATNLGSLGITWGQRPHGIQLIKENNSWYGFVTNLNSIVRISWGNSIMNTPTAVDLGNIGNLNPSEVQAITENNIKYLFITNSPTSSISRLNFGNSYSNAPTGVNLGNIGGLINNELGLRMIKDCDHTYGFISNYSSNNILLLNFSSGLGGFPTISVVSGTYALDRPHSLSNFLRYGDSLYAFHSNYYGNNIVRFILNAPTCNNSSIPSSNLQTPPPFSYNKAGTYTIELDVDECLSTQASICKEIVVIQPNIYVNNPATCSGQVITLTASGGVNYDWSTGQNGNSITVSPTSNTTYTVTGINANGCTNTAEATVTINSTISINTTTPAICNGNTTIVSAFNGTQYTWNTGGTTSDITVTPTTTTTYSVTGINAQGCSGTGQAVVTVYQIPNITTTGNTICYGTTANINANGGTTYIWNTGSTDNPYNVSPTATITYFVTGTDINGCTNIAQATVVVSPQMSANIIKTDATCGLPNASAQVTGNGGIPFTTGEPYTYLWNPGAFTTNIINNVLSKTYSVTVTDSIGCTATASIVIGDNPPIILSTNQTSASCFPDGTADVNVFSGTPQYTYTWSTIPPQYTQTISGINSGQYTVTVIDSNGCSAVASVTVLENNLLSVSTSSTPEHCGQMDGTTTLNASGGNPSLYTYLWDKGGATQTITNLTQGSYVGTVYYGTCEISATATVLEKPGPQADFTYTPSVLDILENTTAFFNDMSTSGGQPIVQWHWNFGNDNSTADIRLPKYTFKSAGTYTVCLKVTDSENCWNLICKPIVVKDIFNIYIPNAFSPNSDMLNEGFIPKGYRIDPTGFTMIIFNRWGEEIYKTTDLNGSWNGRYFNTGEIVQTGVYVYRVVVKERDSSSKHEFIGKVSVIR
ncbi:MAG: gliding motility-associated C-terminal domain-containing protein [Bacteroidales bacterium]|jgi:gliding motility-associated-like protein